jgi:hypothetical protein
VALKGQFEGKRDVKGETKFLRDVADKNGRLVAVNCASLVEAGSRISGFRA